MSQPDAVSRRLADRLLGHHPAALRSVSWGQTAREDALYHLEVETKHGHVLLFDHTAPFVYCSPPHPPDTNGVRCWRDLSEEVSSAFADRPQITAVRFDSSPASWRFELSTGVHIRFVLDDSTPILLAVPAD